MMMLASSIPIVMCLCLLTGFVRADDTLTLAVMPFESTDLSESARQVLAERFSMELKALGEFKVVERSVSKELYKEIHYRLTDLYQGKPDSTGKEIAFEGAEILVAGSIGKLGRKYLINVRILAVESGSMAGIVTRDCECSVEDLAEQMKPLAKELSAEIKKIKR